MEDGGRLLLRERQRGKLYWADKNLVRAFWSWMLGVHGRFFERTVHTLYKRYGIAPLCPSLLQEFHHFSVQSARPGRITVDKLRYDIWEVAATEIFQFFGASFVTLALDLCRIHGQLQVEVDAAAAGEPLTADIKATYENSFWNRPDFHGPVECFLDSAKVGSPGSYDRPYFEQWIDRVCGLSMLFKESSNLKLELDHQPWISFDVTELLCHLFYTWILATKRFDVVERSMQILAAACSREGGGGGSGQSLDLSPDMTDLPLMNLSLSFVLNLNSAGHVRLITSDGLQQLENWLKLRTPSVWQGEDVFSPTAILPGTLIQKLITEIKAAGMETLTVPSFEGSCFDLIVKADLHSSVLELDDETADMARLFGYWLRCPGGRFKHQLILQKVNEEYSRRGWPPCEGSSLVQEIRTTLNSDRLTPEQAQARFKVWLDSFPAGIRKLKGCRSFVNFVAVVSMHAVEGWEQDEAEPRWELVEKLRFHATAGGYHVLKPLLVRANDKNDDAGVNEVVLYLAEELRYWKRLEWGLVDNDEGDYQAFDYDVPGFPPMDMLRATRLPDATREAAGRWLAEPTIALCMDVTEPVLRIVSAWQKIYLGGDSKADESSEALKSLEYCLYLHGGAGCMAKATPRDFEICQRATKDDLSNVVALATGEFEIGPLLRSILEDLSKTTFVMSGIRKLRTTS